MSRTYILVVSCGVLGIIGGLITRNWVASIWAGSTTIWMLTAWRNEQKYKTMVKFFKEISELQNKPTPNK